MADSDIRSVQVDEANRVALYQRVQGGNELTGEEITLLDAYLKRRGFSGELPTGLTIGEMLAEQRGFQGSSGAPGGAAEASPARQATMSPDSATRPGSTAPASGTQHAAPVRPASATLEAGSPIAVRLGQALSSKTSQSGAPFEAALEEDLVAGGRLLAPKGSRVIGRITEAKASGKVKGRARLALTLAELEVGERRHRLQTGSIAFEADATKGQDAKKVGIGAGAGAVIGAIAGGKKGAVIGTAVGAATGGAVVLVTTGDEVELPAEQSLSFALEADLELPVVAG